MFATRVSYYISIIFYLTLFLVNNAFAAEETINNKDQYAKEIAYKAHQNMMGFDDYKGNINMITRSKSGVEHTVLVRSFVKEVADGSEKRLLIIDLPVDFRGTKVLAVSNVVTEDEQWVFLPDKKRVKRISAAHKSRTFMGSEFAYEDISFPRPGKYSYHYIQEKPCGDEVCHIIERTPRYPNSAYHHQKVFYTKKDNVLKKILFYDQDQALQKSLSFNRYKKINDQHWRALEMYMENFQTFRTTILNWSQLEYSTGIKDSLFTPAAMKRRY